MEQLTRPHDRFFKESFSRIETARDFVRHYLPAEITALLKLETLEITKDSFVDKKLKERFSDLVYRVALKEGGSVYVYLLFEHKSHPEPEVALYLLSCMVQLWNQRLKQNLKPPLPPIIPMVVYHGQEKWTVSRAFQDLVFTPGAMKPFVPDFSYRLWDLSDYTDHEIKGGVSLKVAALLLKHIFSENIGEKLPGIFKLLRTIINARSGLEYLEAALRYVSSGSRHVEKDDIIRALKEALEEKGDDNMSTLAEQWIEEGLQKGIKKGKILGLKEGVKKGIKAGKIQEARENVLEAVASRFGTAPDDIVNEINAVNNRALLKLLLRQAIVCTDINVFWKTLRELRE